MVSKDEVELNAAKRLISSTVKSHKGLMDVDVWEDEQGFEKVQVYQATFTMDNVEQPLRLI